MESVRNAPCGIQNTILDGLVGSFLRSRPVHDWSTDKSRRSQLAPFKFDFNFFPHKGIGEFVKREACFLVGSFLGLRQSANSPFAQNQTATAPREQGGRNNIPAPGRIHAPKDIPAVQMSPLPRQ
jgi:hypothetical protein